MSIPKTIVNLYAWVATETDGSEGVPAASIQMAGQHWIMPLLGADMERIKSLHDKAVETKRETKCPRMRLCRFELVEEMEEL